VGRLFGTDGVRGLANGELTAELALDLSVAAAHVLGEAGAFRGHRPLAVVGRDPRASGEFLEAAVVAGLASAGIDVLRLGILPTPGVAHLADALDADLGVMLSASHNPMQDNGIKFFARGGQKLDDSIEAAIEARLREPWQRPTGPAVGRVRDFEAASHRYAQHLVDTISVSLDGLKVVIDCANGAAYSVGPQALRTAGAEVIGIHVEPNGVNINADCGSTHPDDLEAAVVAHGAHIGFALDGDADRCLAVDATGRLLDGDHILAILAVAMRDAGTLAHETVVGTVMSNLGFVQAMQRERILLRQTKVGDRYVLEDMRAHGFSLGGEQSGHVVMLDHATTGDGILTALQVLSRMVATGSGVADLAAVMTALPQVLVNVKDVDKARAETDPDVAAAVAGAEDLLGESGRVLLRSSGTEPVVRVMVEATTADRAQKVAEDLAAVVARSLAL
jgi:phosphoglucosamine mutase